VCSRHSNARHAGFTLVEVLIGLTLSSFVLAAVFSACLMMGRSGMSAIHYSVSESELRRGLEEFSQDVRMAKAIKWNSATSITLTVPDNYTADQNQVTYAWDNSSSGPTAQSFYRNAGNAAATTPRTVYVRGVSSFAFSRFNRQNSVATTDAGTKRIQITIGVARSRSTLVAATSRRSRSTLVAATSRIVTASYTLRNKVIN
jgi:prepilin-type N-terminal cleavage/methylation domain-containing protein